MRGIRARLTLLFALSATVTVGSSTTTCLSVTTVPAHAYQQYTCSFVTGATDTSAHVQFAARDDPGYFYLDDVAVVLTGVAPSGPGANATPELGSGELLATGVLPILAVALYRRRSRRTRGDRDA